MTISGNRRKLAKPAVGARLLSLLVFPLALAASGNFTAAWDGSGTVAGQEDPDGVFLQRFKVNLPPVLGAVPTQFVGANSRRVIALPASDPNGDTVTVTAISGQAISSGAAVDLASGARVTLNADGTLTYEPRGALAAGASDSFTYTISDGQGGVATASVTVAVR